MTGLAWFSPATSLSIFAGSTVAIRTAVSIRRSSISSPSMLTRVVLELAHSCTFRPFAPMARSGEEHWLIEFEYTDALTAEEVGLFFERLAPTLPSDIADNLHWVVRSPHQEQLALQMERKTRAPYHDRVVRFQ